MTMPEKSEDDTRNGHNLIRGGSQFNLRGVLFLTAAFALWLFVLPDFRSEPIAIAIFWTLAVVAGIGGHLLYTYLLPWRGTVATSLVALSVAIFAAVGAYYEDLNGVFGLLLMPIEFFSHQRWYDRIRFTIPVFACIAILTAAHSIKPTLINAIITAIGISLWYGVALLVAANAG